jgi:hypothetical protein
MKEPKGALKQLKSVWGRAGVKDAPAADEIKGNLGLRKESPRSPRYGGVQVSLRITKDERRRLGLIAAREGVSLNEVFSRMLILYEREHGRVELTTLKDPKIE